MTPVLVLEWVLVGLAAVGCLTVAWTMLYMRHRIGGGGRSAPSRQVRAQGRAGAVCRDVPGLDRAIDAADLAESEE